MLTPYAYSKGLTLLKEFYSYTGSLNIGSGLVYKDYNLGEFLRLSIEHYQNNELPVEVIEVIKSLGVDLEKPLPEKESIYYKISEEFLIGYQKAKAYYEANGDICLNAYDQNNPDLGSFLAAQRKRYSLNNISTYEVELLDGLDMLWDEYFKHAGWYRHYCRVRRLYREKKGVGAGDEEYKWLLMNKIAYLEHTLQRKQVEFLNKLRIDEFKKECSIDELKWQYNILSGKSGDPKNYRTFDSSIVLRQKPKETKIKRAEWDTWLKMLSDYIAENGSLPKQDYKTEDGYALGAWINTQKVAFNRGELSEERTVKLKSLGINLGHRKKKQ